MNHYLLFNKYGKMIGYSNNKKVVNKIISTRKYTKIYVEKISDKYLTDQNLVDIQNKKLTTSKLFNVDIFDYEGPLIIDKLVDLSIIFYRLAELIKYLKIDEDIDEFITLLDYQSKEIIKLLNDFDTKIDVEGLIINILKEIEGV